MRADDFVAHGAVGTVARPPQARRPATTLDIIAHHGVVRKMVLHSGESNDLHSGESNELNKRTCGTAAEGSTVWQFT